MKIVPLNDRVVIEPVKQDNKTEGGLFLPEDAIEKPQTGKVIAIGSGLFQDGERVALTVKVGDIILFSKYTGAEIKLDGKKLLIFRESDILAVIG